MTKATNGIMILWIAIIVIVLYLGLLSELSVRIRYILVAATFTPHARMPRPARTTWSGGACLGSGLALQGHGTVCSHLVIISVGGALQT